MDELSGFGWWELSVDIPEGSRRGIPPPEPNYIALHHWAKVSFLQGFATGDARPASRRAHSLAWLLMTTESDLAAAMTFALLEYDRKAHDESAVRGLPIDGWVPVSDTLSRDGMALLAYANAASDEHLASPALAADALRGVPPLLACVIATRAASEASMRAWLGGSPTGRPATRVAGCRMSLVNRLVEEITAIHVSVPPRVALRPPPERESLLDLLGIKLVESFMPALAHLHGAVLTVGPACTRGALQRRLRPPLRSP